MELGGATEIDNFTNTPEQSGPREAKCLTLRVPCQGTQGQVSQEPEVTGEEPPGLMVEGPPRRAWSRAHPRQGPGPQGLGCRESKELGVEVASLGGAGST